MKTISATVLAALLAAQAANEVRVDDTDYEKLVAVHVKAIQAIEKGWRQSPVESLRAIEPVLKTIESDLPPRLSQVVEATIAVRVTRGIDKGEIKEHVPF